MVLPKHVRIIACIFALAVITNVQLSFAQVTVEGFVPPGLTSATIAYEYKRIAMILGTDPSPENPPLKVTFYPTQKMMTERTSLPEWGGGGAVGVSQVVVALNADPFIGHNPVQVTVHELVHIAIARAAPGIPIPRWFHEGVAKLLSAETTFHDQIALSRAIFMGELLDLAAIDSVNSFGRLRARLAYTQSHQAVQFLVDTYGIDILPEILSATVTTGSFWGGVYKVLSIKPPEFEVLVRDYLIKRFRMAYFFADTYLLWLFMLMLLIVGFFVTRARNRRKAAEMDEDDLSKDEAEGGNME